VSEALIGRIQPTIPATGLALVFLICGVLATVTANDAPLGSPDFRPSSEHPFGWRGDGSGRFPGANPPVHWGRAAKSIKALRSQATKPKAGETGKPIPDGVIHEWLVLGPVPLADEASFIKGLTNMTDLALAPGENDKVENLSWRKAETDTATLDLYDIYGESAVKTSVLAFAHAYLYSESKAAFRLLKEINCDRGGNSVATYVNGTLMKKRDFELEKGWNSIVLRIPSGMRLPGERIRRDIRKDQASRVAWYVQPVIYGAPGSETESGNIRWTTRIPGWSISSPVMAGNRIFILGDRRTLTCVDKMSGAILWSRTATYIDAASEEEKKANPEIFKELEPLASRLAELDKMFATSLAEPDKFITEKAGLEGKIEGLMLKVDKAKYKDINPEESGYSPRTPVTDGKNVYVNYHPCLTACYDLDGKLKWIHYEIVVRQEHGFQGSPCLVGGKLVVNADKFIAFDAGTGKVAWRQPGCGGSSLLGATFGGEPMVFAGGTSGWRGSGIGAIRAKDGAVLAKPGWGFTSPVIQGNMIYSAHTGLGEYAAALEFLDILRVDPEKPTLIKTVKIDTLKFLRLSQMQYVLASPLYHDGLVYIVDVDGVLSVVDVEKQEVVYQKFMDMDIGPGGPSRGATGSSPALGGKYVYVFGNGGTCVVFEPGRQYRQIAKNRVECFSIGTTDLSLSSITRYSTQLEQTTSCPVFDGSRMYYRGLMNLYCVEEK